MYGHTQNHTSSTQSYSFLYYAILSLHTMLQLVQMHKWNQMRIKNIKFNAKNTTAATCYNSNIFGCYIVATY